MQSPMGYILQTIYSSIPKEILDMTFEPTKNQSTLDELIIDNVIAARVLMDLNLVSGLRAKIPLIEAWRQPVESLPLEIVVGSMYDAAYYLIPKKDRQHRNIIAIEQISSDYSFAVPSGGVVDQSVGILGNSVADLARVAITTRTQFNQPIMPTATLLSNNFVKVYPWTYSEGLILECTLEFDRELTNMNQNLIIPTRNLSLCAVKAFVYNKLRIRIDMTEITAGMTVGSVKDIVLSYENENTLYDDLLLKVRGATLLEPDHLSAIALLSL